MGLKGIPEAVRKTVNSLLPQSKKTAQQSGSLAGRKVSATEGKATEGLKETRSHSLKPHRISLSERQAGTVWGKSLITLGIARQAPASETRDEAPVYTSLPKNIQVSELKETPEDTSDLPGMDPESLAEEIAEKLQLKISDQKEGEGKFGEVRAAVPAGEFRAKPMRALKTTFNRNHSLEIELQGRLKHPNIARLKNAWRSEDVVKDNRNVGQAEAMEMEFVGQSLQDVINPSQKLKRLTPSTTDPVPERLAALKSDNPEPLPSKLLKKVAVGTLDALYYLHHQNPPIAHFDVHPGNILVGGSGQAKLTDFGCAKELSLDGTYKGNPSFNTKYNGPELWTNPPILSPKTDMWGLGCTLFEAATGEKVCSRSPASFPPDQIAEYFTRSMLNALEHDALNTEENRVLKDLLSHLLVIDPEERYSAAEAINHSYFTEARYN